ncbi:hypothetical protein YC2023_066948 [Brassica napus]
MTHMSTSFCIFLKGEIACSLDFVSVSELNAKLLTDTVDERMELDILVCRNLIEDALERINDIVPSRAPPCPFVLEGTQKSQLLLKAKSEHFKLLFMEWTILWILNSCLCRWKDEDKIFSRMDHKGERNILDIHLGKAPQASTSAHHVPFAATCHLNKPSLN